MISEKMPAREILVIDDSLHDYETYTRYLSQMAPDQYKTHVLSSAKEIFPSLLTRKPPYCVLLDLRLPDIDGIEILRRLKSHHGGILPFPIVMVTGSGDDVTGEAAVQLGAQDYLIKEEVTPRALLRAIHFAVVRFNLDAQLRESEHRFRSLAENVPEMFWILELPERRYSYFSPSLARNWGFDPNDLMESQSKWFSKIHPDDRSRVEAAFREKAEIGLYDEEYRIVRDDGTVRWISVHAIPMRDPSNKLARIYGISRDITEEKSVKENERKLTAEAVAATAKFRAIFEQTSVFAGILTLDGIVIDANSLALNMCGYLAQEVLNRPFWETPWWRNSEDSKIKIHRACLEAAKGIPFRAILPYYWENGTERILQIDIHPIRDNEGRIIFLHPTGIDVTDLKRVEGELRKSHEDLENKVGQRTRELAFTLAGIESEVALRRQTEEQLRALSAQVLRLQDEERRRIARDLHDSTGQTLSALKLTLGQLKRSVPDAPGTSQLFDDLEQLADQGLNEVRTISYLLHPPMLDEIGFTSAAEWYAQGFSKRSGIQVQFAASGSPTISKPVELALFRVLQECLTNVLRHSESHTADVKLFTKGSEVLLEVKDYGKGIPQQKLNRFNETGAGVGVGMGGMSQRLRDFGGRLLVKSDEGGTTVCAIVPMQRSDSQSGHDSQPPTRSRSASAS